MPSDPVVRKLLAHGCDDDARHENVGHRALCRRLAGLMGLEYGGDYRDGTSPFPGYIVARQPLAGLGVKLLHNIRDENDLFGGWVEEDYMATKAIMHCLVEPGAQQPRSWPSALAAAARGLTLPGLTAFSRVDAAAAGRRLLAGGPVRLKPVASDGGRGQIVCRNQRQLEEAIDAVDAIGQGVVVEQNLQHVTTYSVGHVTIPSVSISYCGTQSLTPDNTGAPCYGGSEIFVVRGGFDRLLERVRSPQMAEAIEMARRFDRLAHDHLPGLIASRRNYDIAAGISPSGQRAVGVLEQSWRIGGASSAEIVAMEAMLADPLIKAVYARSVERFGDCGQCPPDALVCFDGIDPNLGPIQKFAQVEEVIADDTARYRGRSGPAVGTAFRA